MRLVVADCSIDYSGRLFAHLPAARRLLVVKDDGTVIVHSDRGHKALNWMSPPCRLEEHPGGWVVIGDRGERLVEREFPTDLGPVDLLLRDAAGRAVAVEVKRVAELASVEQLVRYLERLNQDASLAPARGILAAQTVKPQTRVLATSRGIECVEVDFDVLAGRVEPEPTLF